MAAELDLLLGERERLAECDADLLTDEVEPGHHLGHGVLHLDPRVHLHEEVVALRGQEPLDRARRPVPGRPRGRDPDLAEPGAEAAVDRGRGSLLDELLVAALDRAVALAEVDHVPVRVREHLHLDVAWVDEQPLDVDGVVAEVRAALAPGGLERALRP